MPQELARGANCPIPSPTVTISVACASQVDVSALLLGADGKVRSDADLIFYNQPTGPGVQYLNAAAGPRGVTAITITTGLIPADVDKVAITASLDGAGAATFGAAGSLVMTVIDQGGTDAVTGAASGLSSEAALIVGEVYRRNSEWKLRSVMQGYDDGLAGIATEFGVDVDDDTPDPISSPSAPVQPIATLLGATASAGAAGETGTSLNLPPIRLDPPAAAPTQAPSLAMPSIAALPVTPPTIMGPINLDKGRISLEKRQTVSLTKTGAAPLKDLVMGLGWDPARAGRSIDLDASVIAFNDRGKDVDKIWFMSQQGCKGSIRHAGDNLTGAGDGDDEQIRVDLSKIPSEVTALVFTVNSFSGQKFTEVRSAYCRLIDSLGTELVRFSLTESQPETGVIMCTMRRAGGTWNMTAIGEFHKGKTVRSMVDPARAWLQTNA